MSAPAKVKPVTAPVLLTANDLRDGRVVWLTSDGSWTLNVTEARLFAPDEAAQALALGQAAERLRQVVGAYLTEAELKNGVPMPRRFREKLRAVGPSVDAEPKPSLSLAS